MEKISWENDIIGKMASVKNATEDIAAIKERLEYLREQIENENISWDEIHELQSLAKYIEPGDVVLLEWAGVPEFPEDESEEEKGEEFK